MRRSPMAPEASLVVFVVGLAGSALDTLDAAIERSLGSSQAVVVMPAPHLPRDVDAFDEARRRGATAIVELVTDERLDLCELRVCPVDEPCSSRTVVFGSKDARDARERAISIVAVAMLPERTRTAAAQPAIVEPRAPVPTPAPVAKQPLPATPRFRLAAPRPPSFQLEAGFSGAFGSPSTLGAEAGIRARALSALWVRLGAGARAGSLAGLARAVDVPLTAGLAITVPVAAALDLGARADASLQWRSVSVPERGARARWLGALRAGFEGQAHVSRSFGLRVFAAVETNLGSTAIQITGLRASLAPVRAYVEVGPYLTF